MSKVKSLLPEDYEGEQDNGISPEEAQALTDEEMAEAEMQMALWSAAATLKDYMWEVNIVLAGVRYNGIVIADHQPDHREAVALIATEYKLPVDKLLDAVISGRAAVLSHKPRIYNLSDIQANYIPF